MSEFWEKHNFEILFVIVSIVLVGTLWLITDLVLKLLIRRANKKRPYETPSHLIIVRKIFRYMWTVIGLLMCIYVFLNEEFQQTVKDNIDKVYYIGLVLIATIIIASKVQLYFTRAIKKISESEHGDPTSYRFLRYLSVFMVYFLGLLLIIMVIPSLKGVAKTALGGAGVLALVAGFASQEALSNIIGGIFIISFKPFKLNDIIKISDEMLGTVVDITLRHTVIKNFENKMIIIPNSIINKEKVINFNYGDPKVCQWIEVGISYDSNSDLALDILRKECESHPQIIDVRTNDEISNGVPKVVVRLVGLGDSSVNLKAWAWSQDYVSAYQAKCDILHSIKKKYDDNGIEIPFPHRTMVFKENQLENFKSNFEK
ncbi:mechanosensitive ion channel family protein [Aegicerativicinus sediminis]